MRSGRDPPERDALVIALQACARPLAIVPLSAAATHTTRQANLVRHGDQALAKVAFIIGS